ncbi:MAG: DUF2188 domain-containing protein [Proteobacteria bacterium]|nr:DUF2188 domain-containing protein [Pseudomonadota bacterium]
MFGKNQYVVKRDDGRAVCREGNNQDPSHHPTQKDAYDAAREIAITQKCEVIIPGRDSKIRDNNSFENVPCSPRDKIYFFLWTK